MRIVTGLRRDGGLPIRSYSEDLVILDRARNGEFLHQRARIRGGNENFSPEDMPRNDVIVRIVFGDSEECALSPATPGPPLFGAQGFWARVRQAEACVPISQRDSGDILEQDVEDPRGIPLLTPRQSAKQDLAVAYSNSPRLERALQSQREISLHQLVRHLNLALAYFSVRRLNP